MCSTTCGCSLDSCDLHALFWLWDAAVALLLAGVTPAHTASSLFHGQMTHVLFQQVWNQRMH